MSKRRLSRQQTRRIAGSQRRSADRAGEASAQELEPGDLGAEQPARVLAQYGREVDLLDAAGEERRCFLRANLETPVAGDHVVFRPGESAGGVVAVQPRSSELRRPDRFGKLRVIAANIDRVLVVLAALPEPHGSLIDRYLVACENLGAEALLLLNKCDLLDATGARETIDALLAPYPPLGYSLLRASASTGAPDAVADALAGHTSILVGQSGVGKTTLLNALLPDAGQRVGELSAERGKGRHTTTTSRLFELPRGGAIIDSPGIREFGLWHLERDAIDRGFREIHRAAADCRFRDCRHAREPDCAVNQAVSEGHIHPARWDSYQRILGDVGLE